MKYRINTVTYEDDSKQYFPQYKKRSWWPWWSSYIEGYAETTIRFDTYAEAEQYIQEREAVRKSISKTHVECTSVTGQP